MKRVIFLVVLFFMPPFLFAAQTEDLFKQGETAYKSKDYSKALGFFEQVVQAEPLNAKYQYNLGLAARKLYKYTAAARAFQEAKKLDPAIGFTKNPGDFEEKLAEMVSLSDANTASARGVFDLGEKAYKEKDYAKAYEGFQSAVIAEPENAKYQYNLGLAARKLQKYPEALKAFQEAARLDPEINFTNDKQGFKDKLEEAVKNAGTNNTGNDGGQNNISLNDETVFPIFLTLLGGGGAAAAAYFAYKKRKNRITSDDTGTPHGTTSGNQTQDPYNDYSGTVPHHTNHTHTNTTHNNTASHSTYRDRS